MTSHANREFTSAMLVHKPNNATGTTGREDQTSYQETWFFCSVFDCTNRSESCSKSFFRIPSVLTHHDEETKTISHGRRLKWFNNIKCEDMKITATHYRVCSDHFISGEFY